MVPFSSTLEVLPLPAPRDEEAALQVAGQTRSGLGALVPVARPDGLTARQPQGAATTRGAHENHPNREAALGAGHTAHSVIRKGGKQQERDRSGRLTFTTFHLPHLKSAHGEPHRPTHADVTLRTQGSFGT